jgi:hypothetical protein
MPLEERMKANRRSLLVPSIHATVVVLVVLGRL